MKDFIKSKKFLVIIIILLLICLIWTLTLLFKKNSSDLKKDYSITTNYVAYIKINPSIKLEYSQTCVDDDCSNPKVIKYDLINDDAKNIYKDINLTESSTDLIDVLNLITQTAKDNNINVDTINIYTNWNKIDEYVDSNNKENDNNWNYIMNVSKKDELNSIEKNLEEDDNNNKEENKVSEIKDENKPVIKPTSKPNSTDSNTDKKEEINDWTEISDGLYWNGAANGYGDYVKVYYDKSPLGNRVPRFISTSKLGCKDASDKQACKEMWIKYFEPKIVETKKDYDSAVANKNEYIDMIKRNGYLEKYHEYVELIKKCDEGDKTQCYDEESIRDGFSNLKSIYEGYDDMVAHFEDQVYIFETIYNEHLTAINIYKAL